MHDELDGNVWEAKILQAKIKKIPIDVIKGFLKVELESHITFFLLRSSHVMKNFLQNNGVIRCSPTRQKAALEGANNIIKDRSKTLNQNFSDDFVNNVTQTDGPKVFVSVRWVHLRNKCNESV